MTTNEITEPIVEETPPRELNELLAMNTYQGMSDDEIEMLFDYRLEHAMKGAEIDIIKETNKEIKDTTLAIQASMLEESRLAMNRILERIANRPEPEIRINIPEEITPPNLVNLSEVDSNG